MFCYILMNFPTDLLNVTESIRQFLFPLQPPDEEPIVNLSEILTQVYQEAALDLAMATPRLTPTIIHT
jgi:Protein of unknown function (DUF4058)